MQKEISPWEVICLKASFHGGGEKQSLAQTFLTSCFVHLLPAVTGCCTGLIKTELEGDETKIWGPQHRRDMDVLD